ncbi:hypothetical protein FG002_020445 [Chitinimonas sp. BJB300]|nr:hypothetical protein FG002_020445 [Chitinimonas sp. BJB300]
MPLVTFQHRLGDIGRLRNATLVTPDDEAAGGGVAGRECVIWISALLMGRAVPVRVLHETFFRALDGTHWKAAGVLTLLTEITL